MRTAIEFWTKKPVPVATARVLDWLRPRPYVLRGDELHPLTKLPMGVRRWRFEVGRKTKSKRTCLAAAAKWAASHRREIRMALRSGLHCELQLEIFLHHWRYELPIETEHAAAIQKSGLRLHVAICRC
jgi:hypothetical protein